MNLNIVRFLPSLSAFLVALACASCATAPAAPQPALDDPRYSVPASISPQAQAVYRALTAAVAKRRASQSPAHTAEEFAARRAEAIARTTPQNAALLQKLEVSAVDTTLGGVAVVDCRPPHYEDDGTVLVRVHGGGFVLDSARSAIGMDAMVAIATGKRVVSVDYTVAPAGKWPQVTDEVIAVYMALLAQGYPARSIGMYGDSAGGNIVAASVLKLRDRGIEMPGALVLLSPGTDLTQSGDTSTTLKPMDPALGTEDLRAGFSLYAAEADWKNPYVSPVYGDFSKGYPPVLIQAGTREMLLSDSVRLYQAIKAAGGEAVLDIYEGMPHVFQAYMADTPEQHAAFAEIRRFFARTLTPSSRRAVPVR